MKKVTKILALVLAFCMVLSIGVFASGMPDTSQGGSATSSPPDNSTKAVDILGTQAGIYIEYGEDGYTVTENLTDSYEFESQNEITVPVVGEEYVLDGIYIYCGAEDWDDEVEVGNSGIVINQLTDDSTPVLLGGDEDYYEAPDGEMYNSVIVMEVSDDETLASGATETAPGTGIAFNGSAIELKNVYVESNGSSRPSIHIPSTTRDSNATQLPDLICVDTMVVNHSTRAMLLMGGDVWFLNSSVLTNSWGGLSYDNTSTTMYVVNSDVENIGNGGYAIYDAAGCTAFIYGSRVAGGNAGIMVCRTAELTVDSLENADATATDPYDGEADLMTASATSDGRTEVVAHDYPIKIHADMAGADSQATAYLYNAYISTLDEDVQFADGTDYSDWAAEESGISAYVDEYQSGACVAIASHSGKVVFDNCELHSRTGILVHSFFTYDSMASGIYPVDGAEYVGDEVVISNMSAEGDILHDDYMRKMVVSLENAELTGAVIGTTLAAWNTYWEDIVAAMPEEELTEASDEMTAEESTLVSCIYNDTYETVWGVRMSMDGDSVWTVTGDSNLYSFEMEDGAVVQAADGQSITIYVDCTMSNDDLTYDITSGTQIDAFEPGVEYTGVVIVVDGEAEAEVEAAPADDAASAEMDDSSTSVQIELNGDVLTSMGIATYVDETGIQIYVGGLLDSIGAEMSYDPDTEILKITDTTGMISAAILGGMF